MLGTDFLLTKIRKLHIWIETDLSHRRNIERMNFFHWKSCEVFHEAWNSVTQSSAMWRIHTNGQEIADVLSGKNIFSTVDPKLHRKVTSKIQRATKLYFMYYLLVVIILFCTGLYKSAFSSYSFGKTRFSSFCVLVFLFLYLWLSIFRFAQWI